MPPELETAQPAAAASPEPAPIAPVQTEPSPAPQTATPAAETPAPATQVAETATPVPEAAVDAPEAPKTASSLVNEKPPEKPAPETEPKKPEPAPADKPAPAEAPAEPSYQAFTLPEGVSLKDEEIKEVHALFAEGRISQEYGQKLMDRYAKEVTDLSKRMAQNQWDTWNRTQDQWRSDFASDPEIGGNRRDTTIRSAASVLERFGTPKLREALDFTGMGNHPELIRLLDKVGKFMGEGKPVVATKAVPQPKKTRAETLYDHKE